MKKILLMALCFSSSLTYANFFCDFNGITTILKNRNGTELYTFKYNSEVPKASKAECLSLIKEKTKGNYYCKAAPFELGYILFNSEEKVITGFYSSDTIEAAKSSCKNFLLENISSDFHCKKSNFSITIYNSDKDKIKSHMLNSNADITCTDFLKEITN